MFGNPTKISLISVYRNVSFCISIIFLLNFQQIKAQSFFFTSIGVENGLPSNVTNSIVQDLYGFIWIGTQEGVCRSDGYKMVVFKSLADPASIPSNNISTLLLDGDIVWVGTWNGLCTINTKTFKVQRVNIGISKAIRSLYKDNSGNIWIGASNGLIIYNKKEDRYQFFDADNSNISHNTIRAFYQTKNGDMWIGTYNGLNRCRNNHFEHFNLKGQYKPLLKNNLICSIIPFSEKNDSLLWVGTETGLCLFNTYTGEYKVYNLSNTDLSNEVIKCIYSQNDSLLWLGTDFGLNIFNYKTKSVKSFYHDPLVNSTISNNVIWQIYEDDANRLWLITSNGASLLDNHEKLYRFYEEYHSLGFPKIGNQIRDILISKDGKTWLGTLYGVICKDPKTGKTEKFTADGPPGQKILLNNVFALFEDPLGMIWMGTAGGINIWDPKKKKMYSVSSNRNNGLSSNYISGFALHSDSSVWVSAWEGGLFKVVSGLGNPDNMKFILVDTDGDGTVVSAGKQIFYASHKELWRIDLKTYEKKPVEEVNKFIKNNDISCILGEKNGNVWIGTDNILLKYTYQTEQIQKLQINIGLQNKLISLLNDDDYIWASTNNSIIRIDFESKKYLTIPISRNSPLKSFYQRCAENASNGIKYFGGDNGYIEIDSKTLALPQITPQIYITNLSINNQNLSPFDTTGILNTDIAFCEKLVLNHNQNSLKFEFSSLDYLFPGATQFAYRLLNHDNQWYYTSDGNNFAVFSNLSPGEYIFEVKGTDHFGIWSKPTRFTIRIKPPYWLQTPFIILYILLLSGLSYYIFRILKYRNKIKQELRLTIFEKQHAEELFKSKQQFFTNISHEFRTPLSLILPPIQQILKSEVSDVNTRKLLKLAKRNAQRLYKLINQLLDFGKIESSRLSLTVSSVEIISFCKFIFSSFTDMARRNEINYQFNSEIKNLQSEIDLEKFETILFNLLSNAFKYTLFGGSIELKILPVFKSEDQEFLLIKVIDNGIGISDEDQKKIFERFYQTVESKALNRGYGIGLTLAQEYARLHNGLITVESYPDKGSTFTIKIPIRQISISDQVFEDQVPVFTDESNLMQEQVNRQNFRKIVIIDDNEDILDYIEMNLINQYNVFRATDGKQGLEMVLKVNPNLVISDIMMPVMDGLDLCTQIRQNQAIAHIPIILLSAKTLPEQKAEGMNTGADLYISKPFDIEYFKSCIKSIFRRDEQISGYIKNELILNPENGMSPEKNQNEKFLKKVIEIIEKNLGRADFSVEMLSDEVGMSSTHLYRKLKLLTNQSTIDIIKNYRMQKAAQMLKNNEGNITEIMYAVGFSSLSSFSKSFKSVFNVSPSMYAEQFKKL